MVPVRDNFIVLSNARKEQADQMRIFSAYPAEEAAF
jgi:hypothetical protein